MPLKKTDKVTITLSVTFPSLPGYGGEKEKEYEKEYEYETML